MKGYEPTRAELKAGLDYAFIKFQIPLDTPTLSDCFAKTLRRYEEAKAAGKKIRFMTAASRTLRAHPVPKTRFLAYRDAIGEMGRVRQKSEVRAERRTEPTRRRRGLRARTDRQWLLRHDMMVSPAMLELGPLRRDEIAADKALYGLSNKFEPL